MTHFCRQLNCWSYRCSWSIACRHCSNYIFILNLTNGFNRLGKDNCKTRGETFKFWDSVRLILETLRYIQQTGSSDWVNVTNEESNESLSIDLSKVEWSRVHEEVNQLTIPPGDQDSDECVYVKMIELQKLQLYQIWWSRLWWAFWRCMTTNIMEHMHICIDLIYQDDTCIERQQGGVSKTLLSS